MQPDLYSRRRNRLLFCIAAFFLLFILFVKNNRRVNPDKLVLSASDSAQIVIIIETPTPTSTPAPTIPPTKIPTKTLVPTVTPTPVHLSSSELDRLFTRYANKESVDPALLRSIAVCESGLRFTAVNGPYAGLFQFSEHSWKTLRRAMNLDSHPGLRFDPEEAIKTAAYKLALNGRLAWPNCTK